MNKNKVVIYSDEKGARIFTTDEPEGILYNPDVEKKFINPELGLVSNYPPEYWYLEDGERFIPLQDPAHIKQRMAALGVREFHNQVSAQIRGKFHTLVDIPEKLEHLREKDDKEWKELFTFLHREHDQVHRAIYELNINLDSKYVLLKAKLWELGIQAKQRDRDMRKTIYWLFAAGFALELGMLIAHNLK